MALGLGFDFSVKHENCLQQAAQETQEILERKNSFLQETLEEFEFALDHKQQKNCNYEKLIKLAVQCRKENTALLAFKKDSLFFWSNNAPCTPHLKKLNSLHRQVGKFDDGWYAVQKKNVGDFQLYGLVLIKKKYAYQNQFLRNHFSEDFNLSAEIEISLDPEKGEPVFDFEGNFLFSLEGDPHVLHTLQFRQKTGMFYVGFIVFALLFVSTLILKIKKIRLGLAWIFAWGLVLLALRYLMMKHAFPSVFAELTLFSPSVFAGSVFFPSLGDALLNVLFLYLFVHVLTAYVRKHKISKKTSKLGVVFVSIASLLVFWLLFVLFSNLLRSLVFDSDFSLQDFIFQENGFYVFVSFFILSLLVFTLGQFAYFASEFSKTQFGLYGYTGLIFCVSIPTVLAIFLFQETSPNSLFLFLPLAMLFLPAMISYRSNKNFYSSSIVLLLCVTFSLTEQIYSLFDEKETQNKMIAAMNLSAEYDSGSEHFLAQIQKQLKTDLELVQLCKNPFRNNNEERIKNHIQKTYFSGYWEQYYLQVTICTASDDLSIKPDSEIVNCFDFFEEMIAKSGELIPNTNFYRLNEFDGMVSYLGNFSFLNSKTDSVRIFIRLDSRASNEGIGYPDLLLDEKFAFQQRNHNYSYGKYKNKRLIASSGDFNYYMNEQKFDNERKKASCVKIDNYKHVIYQFGENTVVVSSAVKDIDNKASTALYLFVFLYLFGFLQLFAVKFPENVKFHLNFKLRIQYSMIILMLLSFLLLGGSTIYYTIERAEQTNHKKLEEKLQLIKNETTAILTEKPDTAFLTDHLRRLSNLIYTDIHLYDLSGKLMTSSRNEIFDKKLQLNRMNFGAFFQMSVKKRSGFIHKEKIGSMSYLSAYETIVDENNKVLAFVNLPYFIKSEELKQEMFNLLLTGVNLYAFIILLAIFVSMLISNKITQPLRLIQNRLKNTRFGSYGEKIEYSKNDEIGSLVKEYNQMLLELNESAEKLAQSERESAWREMAKQIAHEIKNPLTPMKLSIQFLQKAFNDQSKNKEAGFKQISKTLIEQIDSLSAIATAFSNFAKMPAANNETLNLVDILNQVLSLFKNDELNLNLHLNGIHEAKVFVDKKQLVRVFVNLINNALEAIPEQRNGKISVELNEEQNAYLVCVIDNGIGINNEVKKKLFHPNFTTKSGGMGLGLAIVKNIINNAKGDIWVETKQNSGSCFKVRIPKA